MNRLKNHFSTYFVLIVLLVLKSEPAEATSSVDTLTISGINGPVEIIKDRWGISHIYAQNQADLFFAQGFNTARDRLFQLEMWRRRALGLLAEIQGIKALKHDMGARLLKFRKDLDQEMDHYHRDGREIITSFVRGINAYIEFTRKNPDLLPIEFDLLGIKPEYWTPEVVVSRHNGLFFGARFEINTARAVHTMGAVKTESLLNLHHGDPELEPKEGLDLAFLSDIIMDIYNASRRPPRFCPEDITNPDFRAKSTDVGILDFPDKSLDTSNFDTPKSLPFLRMPARDSKESFALNEHVNTMGSNNWVLSGRKTSSGFPMMANDPHRSLQVPSLRYWAHLVAPGWNVIGGGEPALPGISIGHNEYGAWGLTIFRVDQEDVYVYDTNPENSNEYEYVGGWETMKIVEETIPVKGQEPVVVQLKYTRHGPVLYEDTENHKAYGLRAAWLEIGTAPYLASLRMDQARNWQEFRDACSYSGTPPENMVWADIYGNIGWQAVGLTPLRRGWDGILPVPGDGRFEWTGYLPIKSLPHIYNPPAGHWATANQNNVPLDYPYLVGLVWSDPFRFNRLEEVLNSGKKFTMMDNMRLQQDELSLPARALVPLLRGLRSPNKQTRRAMARLLAWDYVLDKTSIAGAVYVMWERKLEQSLLELLVPEDAHPFVTGLSRVRMIEWLTTPDGRFGDDPISGRDKLLLTSMEEAVDELNKKLGSNMSKWQYGQEKFHHSRLNHMLSDAVNLEIRKKLNIGPLPRGGYGYTVNNTSGADNQRSGASFRIIADTGQWDRSLGTNTPGQSGDPESRHYADLFKMWAEGKYFPVFYSRDKIESVTESITLLNPSN